MSKKYTPIPLPKKKRHWNREWFEIIEKINTYSVNNRKAWQDKGRRSVGGWCVVAPNGFFLPTTFSVSRNGAKKKILDPQLNRFSAITSSLFSEWEKVGYKLVKVKWVVGK